MTKPGKEVARYADVAMYEAEAGDVQPKVTLLSMTADPLRVIAAAAGMYSGKVTRSPSDVSRQEAEHYFADMQRTKTQAPLEFVDFHFLIEGVTRAFTHQLVRQRTAVYVQESMRFAVKTNAEFEVAIPPSLVGSRLDDPMRVIWDGAAKHASDSYNALVNAGMPAEDARGLLPTNITTRVHYKTNLRGLAEHAGLRLCSQAQYEWKQVWSQMIQEIVCHGPLDESWQQRLIADMFRPVCYQTGRCQFRSSSDRYCAIRDRVEAHYAKSEAPETWCDIHPLEPLREGAARDNPWKNL